jgi:hypothetical protein
MATTTYAIRKDGKTVKTVVGDVRHDGVLVIKANGPTPLVLSVECARLGVSPASVSLVAGPVECLGKLGCNPGGIEVMTAADAARLDIATSDAALDAAIPGVVALMRLAETVETGRDEYDRAVRAAVYGDTPLRAAKPSGTAAGELAAMLAANPRAALYLAAKQLADGAHWADNTGAGAAGKAAMGILLAGGSADEARAALAVRRESWD